jgi:hypothetical protein
MKSRNRLMPSTIIITPVKNVKNLEAGPVWLIAWMAAPIPKPISAV